VALTHIVIGDDADRVPSPFTQEEVMTEIVPSGKAIRRGRRKFNLTNEHIFRLWRAAVKDDGKYVDLIIQKIYDEMMAFDPERSETVIEQMIRRHKMAEDAFRDVLEDMRGFGETSHHRLPAPPRAPLHS
jgi:predicted acylesterase/phospholipase RssA